MTDADLVNVRYLVDDVAALASTRVGEPRRAVPTGRAS